MNQLELRHWEDRSLELRVSDQALLPLFTRQHIDMLRVAAQEVGTELPPIQLRSSTVESLPPSPVLQHLEDTALNPRYTFTALVVGPANRLAYAAAQEIVRQPGTAYSPLFVHGAVGMGKTHLLQAMWHELRHLHPALCLCCTSGDVLAQRFGPSATGTDVSSLRTAYQRADVLFVDNVHLLAGHTTAQEELFHFFNAMHNGQKQVILSSNMAPKGLDRFQDPLLSRFKWGLIVELEPPTPEMRNTIISQRLEEHGFKLPVEIQHFLADTLTGNVRELEGAVLKLIGYASLLSQPLDLAIAKQVLREYLPPGGTRNLTIKEIQAATCEAFNISLADMLSKKRARSLVLPRHIAMFLVRSLTSCSLEEVGLHFGGRDHSTVKHGCEKIQNLMESDSNIQFTVNAIKRKLLVSC